LVEKDELARKDRAKAETRRNELQEQIDSARKKVADIDERLVEIQGAKTLQQQRVRLENGLKQREGELDQGR